MAFLHDGLLIKIYNQITHIAFPDKNMGGECSS